MISDQKDRMIKSMKELKEHCIKGCNDFYVLRKLKIYSEYK